MNEIQDLKQQVEIRAGEIRNLNATVDSLKGVNEELKVRTIPIDTRTVLTNMAWLICHALVARICRNFCRH